MLYVSNDIVVASPVFDIAYSAARVAELLQDKKQGSAVAAQEVPLFPPAITGGFYSLPSYLERYRVAGIKWTSHVKPAAGARPITSTNPYTKPVVMLNSFEDGRPLALVDGLAISAIRTASVTYNFYQKIVTPAGGTGLKNRILCCGAGHQAQWQIIAALAAFPALETLYLWSRSEAHAKDCLERVRATLSHDCYDASLASKIAIVSCVDEVINGVDFVVGATSAAEPYLCAEQMQNVSYIHIGMNDIEGDAIRTYNNIYCDDFKAGTWKSAQSLFVLYRQDNTIESRVTLLEDAPAHIAQPRFMFDTFGLSIFDVGLAYEAYQYAKAHGLGEEINLYDN